MKKNISRTVFLMLLVALMIHLLSGCSNSSNKEETKGGEEPAKVTFAFFCPAVIPADIELVQNAMSDYAREKINVEIELVPISIGNYVQQINLMISGNEKLDIINLLGPNFNTSVSQNKLMALSDELVDEYAPGVKAALGEYMAGTTINGKVYGFAVNKDMAAARGIVFDEDYLNEMGVTLDGVHDPDTLGEVFAQLKEKDPDKILTCSEDIGKSVMESLFMTYDDMGDNLGVLLDYGQNLNVVNLYESQWYEDTVRYIRDWYEKGYILKDNSINPDTGLTMLKARGVASQQGNNHFATAEVCENMLGINCVSAWTSEPFANTGTINGVVMAIPSTCKDPIPALKVLNLLYTDPAFINLLDWGIEGTHYVRVEGTENIITYPEGVTSENSGYAMASSWEFANETIAYVWEGTGDDNYWDRMQEFNDSAIKSKALGFTFDPTPVKSEYAALNNVLNEYRLGLENGEMDPDIYLPKFQEALKSAGIDKVVAEKQAQLDAWAELNGIS